MPKENKKFIIIDANALLHRSFHALPPLATKKGQLINAVYGFTNVLLKVYKEFKPKYMAVAYDRKEKTFRHKDYKEYKAKRIKAPDEFYEQIPMSKEVVMAFGIPVLEIKGYEADDIIGTVVFNNEAEGIETIIVTGDKDSFQLISSKTKVFTLRQGVNDTVLYDEETFKERYGLKPRQMIDLKAIAGDPSDNIPGVKGIGEKGALNLLQKFKSLEGVYQEIEKKGEQADIKPRNYKLLTEQKKQAEMSKKLATIILDVPIKYSVEDCHLAEYDREKIFKLFNDLEFKSLLGRLPEFGIEKKINLEPNDSVPDKKKKNSNYKLINNDNDFADFLTQAKKQKMLAIDTEATSLVPWNAKLLGISCSWKKGEAYYLNIKDNKIWLKELRPLLQDIKIKKCGHNLKYDYEILRENKIDLAPLDFDSMVASYLLNPGSRGHSLDDLALEVFGYEMQPITDLIGKGKDAISMEVVPLDKLAWYAAEDADYTWQLCQYFQPELTEKKLDKLMAEIEMPLILSLAEMERNGVKIDIDFLEKFSRELKKEIEKLERSIYKEAGTEFNINSPKQLKEVLFEKLQISTEGIGKTKTGLSTAAAELEKMKNKHKIIPFIVEYRELAKLQSTYLEALPKLVNQKTGRVHTSFNQVVTATGRLSSSDPNLQNIPIRTETGRRIRNAFIAEKGNKILAADYSQIELRIIASLAEDEKMIQSFKNNEDIHKRTAADIHNIELDEVTKQQRYEAKEVNFGILYGMGAWGLAMRQGMSRERARAFIEKYFYTHPEIQEYLATTINTAKEQEYVETLFGRRRYLPEINSTMGQVRAAAERMAVNMPVQGTAADLMKLAMINVYQKLYKVSKKAKMILQVHDELVLEVPEEDVQKVAKFIREEMNSVHKLKVPIKTDVAVGDNWGELEEI